MSGDKQAYRYIPFRQRDILEMLLQLNNTEEINSKLPRFYELLANIYHYEFHKVIDSLKDSYAGSDPDADTHDIGCQSCGSSFIELFQKLLDKANYEKISETELNQALTESSLFRLRLHVDFSDFSEVLLYCRGVSEKEEVVSSLFGLINKTVRFTNYDRVVVYIRLHDNCNTDHPALSQCKPGQSLIRLFQNVPKADLEMLFPNTAVRMRMQDKLLIGVPAVVSGGVVITTKLGASLVLLGSLFGYWLGVRNEPVELNKTSLMVLLAGVVALGGYLWKQFNNFKNRKLRFMQMLTQNLYFKNLDNNAGVFYRLVNDAEEEECKEALLAYYFLLINESGLEKQQLDEMIEQWLIQQWNCKVDFEIDDALSKLKSLDLLEVVDGRFKAIPLDLAINRLDMIWDNYF